MGARPELDRRCVRFGVFELNTASGELRKYGVRVRLQEQPLKLLLCLLEAPGEMYRREDLIRRIWPEGTFVDYDRGLNAAVTRLRQGLADSADTPRYIETVGRKGYRFIAPVESTGQTEAPPMASPPADAPTVASPQTQVEARPQPDRPAASRWWLYGGLLAIGFAVGFSVIWWRTPARPLQPLLRLSAELGREFAAEERGVPLALSPDGTRVAVTVRDVDGKFRLATRRLDQSQFAPLAGTEGAISPFFSPDGQWIAFFTDTSLKKIPFQGGAPITLTEGATGRGPFARYPSGSWGEDGNIIAMLNPVAGLMRIPATGGAPAPVPGLAKGRDEIDNWPQVLPGGELVMFTRHTGDYDTGNIEVFSLRTHARKTVLQRGFLGRYLPGGHLVFIRQNTLWAAPFDLRRLAVTGVSQSILEGIGNRLGWWDFDFSRTGTLVYAQRENPELAMFWMDRTGKTSPLRVDAGASYEGPRSSPDGKRLAFSMSIAGHQDIWVQDLDRGAASRLTGLPGVNDTPVWTADGLNLFFRSVDQAKPGIYAVRADASGEARRLSDLMTGEFPYSVSRDGKRLVLWDRHRGGNLWTAPIESDGRNLSLGKPESFFQKRFDPALLPGRFAPELAPDGRWVAYCSNESGRLEVYVAPFPGPGGRTQISTDGGKFPVWSPNGRELFFLDLVSNRIMLTSYQEAADSFLASKPQPWSEKRLLDLGRPKSYDVAPDGKRFVVVLYADGTAGRKPVTSLTFLLNFFDELRRRVPTQGN